MLELDSRFNPFAQVETPEAPPLEEPRTKPGPAPSLPPQRTTPLDPPLQPEPMTPPAKPEFSPAECPRPDPDNPLPTCFFPRGV